MVAVGPPLLRPCCFVAVCCAVASAAGCASIRINSVDAPKVFAAWRASALSHADLSPRSKQTLRRFDLEKLYPRAPGKVVDRLHTVALRHPEPDILFALAEINYLLGRAAERNHGPDAVVCYYLCAGYCYHFLFDAPKGELAANALPFDPRFRLACDLYNASLAKCLDAAQRAGLLDPQRQLRVAAGEGPAGNLSVVHAGFSWRPEEFGPLLPCASYDVVGLANHHRTYGLGVPLIGTRANVPRPTSAYYPARVSFPVTAFFRFEGTLAELGQRRAGQLELYNPLAVQTIEVNGRPVPLETDLTTPLGYYLASTRLEVDGYAGFLRPDALAGRAGIYMLEPYQPGKIPVVLVHGLLGSPLTWAPVYNDLQADPRLRSRFQFWAYFYPTGSPYIATAADLRRDLLNLRQSLDPQRRDPALDEMVFVGHSMGGLMSKLTTVQGGDDFWRCASDVPFEKLKLQPEVREELRRIFFFEPVRSVKRVIFLATPHHGSALSPGLPGWLAAHLVRVPQTLLLAAHEVATEGPNGASAQKEVQVPTSVDLLAPGAPALETLAARKPLPGVHYHSVVGVSSSGTLPLERLLGGGRAEVGDGVVPYFSAHLDDAESELVVPADHYNVHHHAFAILEVRRILLHHYNEAKARLAR
jgi:pimeloyl-ACP methyl ester carboxylesterase